MSPSESSPLDASSFGLLLESRFPPRLMETRRSLRALF